MKLFLKLFFGLALFEIIFMLVSMKFCGGDRNFICSISHFIAYLLAFPLYLTDHSYPFYADGPFYFGIGLTIINLLLQTAFVYFLIMLYKSKK
ncbi:MAG: hypothetical protein PSV16_07175 [Flavobacterium sp.]|nr:hypothetical protein [Flavobacterium sp.]